MQECTHDLIVLQSGKFGKRAGGPQIRRLFYWLWL
jgi:hypothetical protein